jgi:hypothetical protein
VSNPGKPHLYHIAARLCILSPNLTFCLRTPSVSFDFASAQSANEIAMAPKQKSQNSAAMVIPPIDPNNQLPFTGNHMFPSRIFSILSLSEFFLRRSFALGGFVVGLQSRQRIPTSPLFTSFSYSGPCSSHFSLLLRSP